ncbi:hypothetical protein F5B22DRAFT_605821 [Xylaria bambusicola]|uniref:uncharacterized protein n=1 Tax=Xylaria bambusicola TaxID=326684 RepID=UPI0020087C30|nr:uncharacterized protein F5B22DRAFT_605821 [Xylaria bambusicola]KAI0517005.1 hypothetical protein F5B22DRAFT_605821 [Xylaria bambusicola]
MTCLLFYLSDFVLLSSICCLVTDALTGGMPAIMSNPPLAPPPPGVVPDFEHPASKKPAIIACLSVILPIATLFVYLRVHVKAFVMREFDASDWFCIIGFTMVLGYTYTIYDLAVIPGAGEHDYELHLMDIPQRYYVDLIISGVFVGTTLLFIKLSLLFLVLRIFWIRRWARYTTIAGIAIHILVYAVYTILYLYLCAPRPGQTAMDAAGSPRCLKVVSLSSFQAVWDAIEDFLILGVSIPILMGLKTTLSRRLRASSVFFVGLTVTAFSIAGAYFRLTSSPSDINWQYPTLFIITYFEMSLALICACLPCLPLLGKSATIKRVMDSRFYSSLKSLSMSRLRTSQRSELLPDTDRPNSSTTNLAEGDSQKFVATTQSFNVEHSYELYPKPSHGVSTRSFDRLPPRS